MPGPAKLELLTRATGESDFQIVELESSQIYWTFKPCRLSSADWELTAQPVGIDGARNYVLKNLREDNYLLLSAREYFLWEQFDGQHTLEEIARAFHFAAGAFDYSVISQLLGKLYHAGLLERRDVADLQPSLAGARRRGWSARSARLLAAWRRLSLKIPNADRLCSAIYNRGGFVLFHPVTFWLSVVMAAVAFGLVLRLAPRAADLARLLATAPLCAAAVTITALLASAMLHALMHALACKAHGRKVREMGFFLLQGILPTFYADVTDIFMSSRRARIMVDLAGPMVEVVLGSAAMVGAYLTDFGVGQALLFGIGLALWESALLNLYPFSFLEMDGYNIIADLLAMPMLRQQALALIPSLQKRLKKRTTIERVEWIQVAYLALCLVSVLAYLIVHLDAIRALVLFSR